MKVGDILKPLELGERSFDPKELFTNLKRNRIVWCWGAQAWTVHKDKFLRFKSNGFLHKGHVYILLGWDDTFTVLTTSMKGKIKTINKSVYVDVLVETIDRLIETK